MTWKETFTVFRIFLGLGLTSFGGPVAHLGYFRTAFVDRLKWLDDRAYADIVALCQFLPGPASSQVGMIVGLSRAGVAGMMAAWAGFTLPSAILLALFAQAISSGIIAADAAFIHGLKLAAVAVVAHAVWTMGRKLTPDAGRAFFALVCAAVVLFLPSAAMQAGVIVMGAVYGCKFLPAEVSGDDKHLPHGIRLRTAGFCLLIFALLLVVLPVLAWVTGSDSVAAFDIFYRAGALVFGGGHVVLPLLQSGVVAEGWVSNDIFMAGYGAAQAVPGPLFTFAAYLGAVMQGSIGGWGGAFLCLGAVFLPSFLLVLGVLPFWVRFSTYPRAVAAVKGINAAVVGILFAALCHPVFTSAVFSVADLLIAACGFALLEKTRCPPIAVVALVVAVRYFAAVIAGVM